MDNKTPQNQASRNQSGRRTVHTDVGGLKRNTNKPVSKQTGRASSPQADLPDWGDLAKGAKAAKRMATRKGQVETGLAGLSTPRFIMLILALASAGILYVYNGYSTATLASEVMNLRQENWQLYLKYNRVKGTLDQKTGPRQIHERAQALGLVDGYEYGPTITINKEDE